MKRVLEKFTALLLTVLFFMLCLAVPSSAGTDKALAEQTSGTQASESRTAAMLPQTGQLWWPVPVLAAAGFVSLAIGWKLDRRQKDEDETENRKNSG
jgi:hypothetical protein